MSVINKIVFQNVTLKVLLEEEGTTYLIVEALQHKILPIIYLIFLRTTLPQRFENEPVK
jgi:hypothetical protein